MRYQENKLQKEVLAVIDKLRTTHTTLDGSLKRKAAKILQASYPDRTNDALYQMVCYYTRAKNSGRDTRRTYSMVELQNLYLMTVKERKEFATHTGKSYRAVFEAITRYQKAEIEYLKKYDAPHKRVTEAEIGTKKFFNFANFAHLQSMHVTPEELTESKRILETKYNLSLRAPNYLYHRATGRCYAMDFQEQQSIIRNPVTLLRLQADRIKDHWKNVAMDPVYADYDAPLYSRVTRHAPDQVTDYLIKVVPKVTAALKEANDTGRITEGTTLYSLIGYLHKEMLRAMYAPTPAFDPANPATYVDDTKPKPYNPKSSPPRPAEPEPKEVVGAEGDIEDLRGKALEDYRKIEDLRGLGHTTHCAQRILWGDGACECGVAEYVEVEEANDEDAWMKEWKPISAAEPELTGEEVK